MELTGISIADSNIDEIHQKLMMRINQLREENVKIREGLLKYKTNEMGYKKARMEYPTVEDAYTKFLMLYKLTKDSK